jgi:hypothetical protein
MVHICIHTSSEFCVETGATIGWAPGPDKTTVLPCNKMSKYSTDT